MIEYDGNVYMKTVAVRQHWDDSGTERVGSMTGGFCGHCSNSACKMSMFVWIAEMLKLSCLYFKSLYVYSDCRVVGVDGHREMNWFAR